VANVILQIEKQWFKTLAVSLWTTKEMKELRNRHQLAEM